jgi:class 3 adenylate cyclase/tetratricopeptide (TPR) repeat protein
LSKFSPPDISFEEERLFQGGNSSMKCPKCLADNKESAKFCSECGQKLGGHCPRCGHSSAPSAKFCEECGNKLAGTGEPPLPDQTKLQLHPPKYLAEKILISRSALEGERKQVTVLFADMKGSMEMLADRDPEDARKILDPVLTRMMEAVHHYEGTVNQVMGDGMMAIFGAPLAHEDHAIRACYAALRMQEGIRRYTEDLRRSQGIEVQIRVGLNSGEVVVRSIGNDLHMDYTAVGQTTHLAARMEQLAAPGSIRITAETLRLAEGFIQARLLGPVLIKGLEEPAEVYEVTGARSVRTRLQATPAQGLNRFVGRNAEIEQIGHALEQAGAGHGQVVAIVGEPGVGKSRLFYEFIHSHRTKGWLVLESGSVSYGKATVYFPVIGLLKAYFKIHDSDDQRAIREKVTGKLLTLDPGLEPTRVALLALFDVSTKGSQWQALDPLQRRKRTLDAVKRLLLRESQVQPLLLGFEDLHWIDDETQLLLESLVESLPAASLLLLVNYRPEYQHGWGGKTYYRQIRLDALPPENAAELLQALLGDDPTLKPLKQLLITRTGGNPLFLEESARMLVETRVLEGERGGYRLAKEAQKIQVPATVQAILSARIDRLPLEKKRLLQSAAVIGENVPFPLLNEIAEKHDEELRHELLHLQAAEFLYEANLFPDLEYTFKHALTHEVAYGTLLHERRLALHKAIVEAIERLYPGRVTEQVERLALHSFLGEVWGKASQYLRQAGAKAQWRSANREAAGYFEQALIALKHLPETRETIEQAIDIRINLYGAIFPLGELSRGFKVLQEAESFARNLGDQQRITQVSMQLAHRFWSVGDPKQAIEKSEQALALAMSIKDFPLQVSANFFLAQACHARGDFRKAIDYTKWNVEALEGDLIRSTLGMRLPPSILSRTWLVWSLAEVGAFAEGMIRAEEGIKIAEEIDHLYSLFHAYWGIGILLLCKGDFLRAVTSLERSQAIAQVGHLPFMHNFAASHLGLAYSLGGRLEEGIALLEQTGEQSASLGMMFCHASSMTYLCEAYLLANRIDEAAETARGALQLCRDHKIRGYEARSVRLLGDIFSDTNSLDSEKSEWYYQEAKSLADELGMRPLIAHCYAGLAKFYRKTGKEEKVQENLETALKMFQDMDMPFWLSKMEDDMK